LPFVNQKDGSFKEEAEKWGLYHPGFSVQAYSFDYNHDGNRDLYLVKYRSDFENAATISDKIQLDVSDVSSDQLFRNDGDHFSNVTAALGLTNKSWGMSAVISDFNDDGWEDIYGEDKLSNALKLKASMIESAYIENLGNGKFKLQKLPKAAQQGPTLSTLVKDIDGNDNGSFKPSKKYEPIIVSDSKDLTEININGKPHYMVVCNNAQLEIFTFEP